MPDSPINKHDRHSWWQPETLGWLTPILLSLQILIGMWLTWGTWFDPIVDFGREIYVPLQLVDGDVLYRDVAYFNGPFSPYLNSLWLRIGGPDLDVLFLANAAVLFLFCLLMNELVAKVSSRPAAFLATSTFLWLCAFNQYFPIANYNWIAPYSHEVTHGLVLSALAIWFANQSVKSSRVGWDFCSGFCCGLIFLTKCEIAVAVYPAVFLLLIWRIVRNREAGNPSISRSALTVSMVFVLGVVLPIVIACSYFSQFFGWTESFRRVLGSWSQLLKSDLTSNPFYQRVMGTYDLKASLSRTWGWCVIYAFVLGSAVGFGRKRTSEDSGSQNEKPRRYIALTLVAVFVVGMISASQNSVWLSVARPWPLILAGLACCFMWQFFQKVRGSFSVAGPFTDVEIVSLDQIVLRLTVVLWAALLLLKILFFCRLAHYGFGLAAPALIVLVCCGWDWWPTYWKQRGYSVFMVRSGVAAILLVCVLSHLLQSTEMLRSRRVLLKGNEGTYYIDRRGHWINDLLDQLQTEVSPDESVLCLPEGVMLNVLAERKVSNRYLNFVPTDILMFGEEQMIDDLKLNAPDWIVLLQRDTSEYGAATFGEDYAQQILIWISDNYVASEHGSAERQRESMPFQLLRRR